MCWRVRRNTALGFGSLPSLCCWYPVIQFKTGHVSLQSFWSRAWRLYGFGWRGTIADSTLPKLDSCGCLDHPNLGLFHFWLCIGWDFAIKETQFDSFSGFTVPTRWASDSCDQKTAQLHLVCQLNLFTDWGVNSAIYSMVILPIATCGTWGHPWRFPRRFK